MKSRKSLSNSEISNLLGLSFRTVENQVYIARNVLQNILTLIYALKLMII